MDINWMVRRAVSDELQRLHDRLGYTRLREVRGYHAGAFENYCLLGLAGV
jgi:hypothetical protein